MEIFYTYLEERTMQKISTEKAMLLWKKKKETFSEGLAMSKSSPTPKQWDPGPEGASHKQRT